MISTSIALFAAIATAKPALEPVLVEWKPKVDVTQKFQMNLAMQVDAGGQMMDINVGFLITTKTTKVEKEQVTQESTMSNFKLSMNGQEMDGMGGGEDQMGEKTIAVRKLNGEVISDTTPAEVGGGERMMRMNTFVYPGKPLSFGDSWTKEWAANKDKGLQSAKAKWTLVGEEVKNKVDCWKIEVVFAEMDSADGISNTGTMWLSKADGEVVYSKNNFMNVSFQEGMPPTNGIAEISRVN